MANQKKKEMVHDFQQKFTDKMKSLGLHFKILIYINKLSLIQVLLMTLI